MSLRETIKQITPEPLWNAAREARNTFRRLPELPDVYLHPWRQASIRNLAALKNIHRGQRAFIIGNGPSLKNTDLGKLKGEYTFGLNRIYLLFPKLGFTTTYYLSINDLVIEQCAKEIRALPIPKFISWRARGFIGLTEDLSYLYTTYTSPTFARDARRRLWEGATVTYVALQLAFHMGFQQVILIGVDHNFVTKGPANTTITSRDDDKDHFAPNYFGKGFRWQLPDLETSGHAYAMARQAYTRAGRQLLDATIGGKLTVFPKVDYNSLFDFSPPR
jgi:hypothetical protein